MRAEDDTAKSSDSGFTDVHALLDKGGAEHKQRCEAAQNDVNQMWFCDVEL